MDFKTRIEYEADIMKAIRKLYSHFPHISEDRILFIEENYEMFEGYDSVHTLPYHIAKGFFKNDDMQDLLGPESLQIIYDMIELMYRNNSMILCSDSGYEDIATFCILNNSRDIRQYLSGPLAGCYYYKLDEKKFYSLEKNPNIVKITDPSVDILELLGVRKKQNGIQFAYFKLRSLFQSYGRIVTCDEPTIGISYFECAYAILDNLRHFPEYIQSSTIEKMYSHIKDKQKDMDIVKYIELLNTYNTGSIAEKKDAEQQMKSLLSPIINDNKLHDILLSLSCFFDSDLSINMLHGEEREAVERSIKSRESKMKEKYTLDSAINNSNKYTCFVGRTNPRIINRVETGSKPYSLHKHVVRKRSEDLTDGRLVEYIDGAEIHTLDGVYQIAIEDVDVYESKLLFTRTQYINSKRYELSITMPIKKTGLPRTPTVFEEIIWKMPNGDIQRFSNEIKDLYCEKAGIKYVFETISGDNKDCKYYTSIDSLVNEMEPVVTQTIKSHDDRKDSWFGSVTNFLKRSNQGIEKMPKAAIIHGVKGVISRDFLEVFRQVIPGMVTEIECKGVRILAEDVDRYSNKFKEEVEAASSKTTRTYNTGTDFDEPI